jgi:O-acetyl-ADP-ribose deacetylase
VIDNGKQFAEGKVVVTVGDITTQDVDVIVNAANWTLLGGGGVDGAIHKKGGPAILEECQEIRRTQYPEGLPPGAAVITTAGDLPARFVVHTVGPIYGRHDGREPEILAACYRNSLLIAANRALQSIAFPAISTGAFGYPAPQAAAIASQAIMQFLASDSVIRQVRLVFFGQNDMRVFLKYHRFISETG